MHNNSYRLAGKRVIVTNAGGFMGPQLVKAFDREGALVLPDHRDLTHNMAAHNLIEEAGDFDVLVVNLNAEYDNTLSWEVTDNQINTLFEEMVYPLFRIGRAALPHMMAKGSGKIIVISNISPFTDCPQSPVYVAAKGAQLAWVKATGLEVASHNIQINTVPRLFIDNDYDINDNKQALRGNIQTEKSYCEEDSVTLALILASDN